jgi:hypothetical protein
VEGPMEDSWMRLLTAHQWADGQRVFRLLQLSPITVQL